MKRTLWLVFVGLPVALVAVVFSVANRHPIEINLWPLERIEMLPAFAVILAVLICGFLLGAIVMWLSAAPLRDRARRARYQKDDLERELAYLRRQLAKADDASTRAAAAPPAIGPAAARRLPAA